MNQVYFDGCPQNWVFLMQNYTKECVGPKTKQIPD